MFMKEPSVVVLLLLSFYCHSVLTIVPFHCLHLISASLATKLWVTLTTTKSLFRSLRVW